MTTKGYFIVVLSLMFSLQLFAQKDVAFDKRNFKDQKKEFKEAVKQLDEGENLVVNQPFPLYEKALKHYLRAQQFNPNNAYVNYRVGECYLHATEKFEALSYFQKAHELNPEVFPDLLYKLGRGYHLKMEWDTAIEHYEKYLTQITRQKGQEEEMARTNKRLKECRSGKELVANPTTVWIDNLGAKVNSKYPEYGMVMTADAQEVFFTSRRPSTTGGEYDDITDGYFEDVYTSNRYETGEWTSAINMPKPVNTNGHDAAVALNPDGSKMILYKDDKGDGNLYETVRKGDSWSKPKSLGKEINSKFHESSASYSPDGKILYFVSERPESGKEPGDKDIFMAHWDDKKEKWTDVERLPQTINSPYDENGIFVHPDGKTIYFSSKGFNSMGGYDIFKSVRQEDGSWSEPKNMGYPINTPDDDVFFVVAANGRDAYMTSYREDGLGDKDLYKVTLLGEKKKPIIYGEDRLLANQTAPSRSITIEPEVEISNQLTILKGIVRDDETHHPLKAEIELFDNETGEMIAEFSSDEKTGRFLVTLPGEKNYGVAVKAPDYLFHSENFQIGEATGYQEVEKIIDLKKVNVGKSIVLRNIFFDFDKYSLRKESENELQRLTALLKDNPSIKIEISGHTDSRGSAAYNKNLSKNRAKTVVDYLIDHGIDKDRLVYEGYGSEQPIVTNTEIQKMKSKDDIEDAHQENRRTEFKILEK